MIDHDTFLARVDACLDERRDPLDDADVVAFLDAHPEHLQAFAEQRADLHALAGLPAAADRGGEPATARRAPRRRRLLPLLAATAVAAGVAFAVAFDDRGDSPGVAPSEVTPPDRDPPEVDPPIDGPPPRAASRILSASLETHTTRAYASVDYTVFRPLVQDTHTTFETYELHSLQHKP